MRLIIIVPDNSVTINGRSANVNLSGLISKKIHAVQWYETFGEIEFATVVDESGFVKPGNKPISNLDLFQPVIDAFNAAIESEENALKETENNNGNA